MNKTWWKESVVYQIYPRSFMDANGDGVGDLQGILSRLDYLKELGIDVIWLSPIYQSPNDDNGYDISDYYSIMDEFGTMRDFDELLQEAHKRGIRIVMDLVVNHTSDEHPWFIESKSSKDNPKRDYYIWRAGTDGQAPNNWTSHFSGSAWELDEATGEFYLHLFSKKQPDLNWENKEVRQAVYDMMKFWLDKGVDGFRMDVINMLSKNQAFPDGPETGVLRGGAHYLNGPRIHEFLQEMYREVLSRYDILTVGETPGVSPADANLYTGEDRNELNMVFQFEHMGVDKGPQGKWDIVPWKLTDLKQILSKWEVDLNGTGWNSLYLNNHDQPRLVSRFGDDGEYRVQSAQMLATFLHLLQGTPYVYQGEEIGMTNVRFDSIADYQDVEIKNMWNEVVQNGGADPQEILEKIWYRGRDNARTPMQWDNSPNAGFTTETPWLQVNPNYQEINVQSDLASQNSIFRYYQTLIRLRKEHEIIVYGDYRLLLADDPQLFAYVRTLGQETLLVVCNFSREKALFQAPEELVEKAGELLLGNYQKQPYAYTPQFELQPYEARVFKL